MKGKAAIIGSGIGGMATAARLAASGWQVSVFEANTYPGGKVALTGDDNYRFDAGPSLFTLPQLLDNLIADCGKNPRDYYDYYAKDIACQYFWEDGTRLTAYADAGRFALEVEDKLGVDAQKVKDYLAMSAHIYRKTTPVFLEKSLHRLKSYLNRETLSALSQIHKMQLLGTLHRLNHKKLQHPKLVQLFDRFATYNGSSPYLTPGVMSSISHLEHNIGTYYPKGGMHSITQTLYQLGKDLGVAFHFNSRVEEIITEGGKAVAVKTAASSTPYDLIVSNADVVPTYRKLLPTAVAPEKTLSQPRSSSALIFYWGIKGNFEQLDLHNIFFSDNYRAEFAHIFEKQTVYHDPTVYVNISSKEEAQDAPPGCENWFVMVNVPGNTGQDWPALKREVKNNVLAKLSRILKRNIADLIEYEHILEPITIEQKTGSFQGSLYGASSNNLMAAFLRHPNFSQRIKDLYFCGGSVHPGGGVPLCLLSAKITVSLIEERKPHG